MDKQELYRRTVRVRNELQRDTFFDLLTESALEAVPSRSAAIFLADFAARRIHCRSVCFRDRGHEAPRKAFGFDEAVEGWVLEHFAEGEREGLVINDPKRHALTNYRSEFEYQNVMVIPFVDEMEGSGRIPAGTLTLFDAEGGFTDAHRAACAELAEAAAIALFHSSVCTALHSTRISLKDTLERKGEEITELHRALRRRHEEQLADIRLAARIHRTLIAGSTASLPGYRVASRFRPSRHLGGDYLDLVRIAEDRYALVVADVSGSGVTACLLAAFAREAFRQAVFTGRPSAEAAMREAASVIAPLLPEQLFLTAALAFIAPQEHRIDLCVAGHPAPIRFRAGYAEEVPVGGDAIGIGGGLHFGSFEISLAPSERLFFYTDGIVEIMTPDQIPFGHKRLFDLLVNRGGHEIHSVADLILRAGEIYAGASEALDDRALMILERID